MTYLEFKNCIEKEWLKYLGTDTSKAKIRFIQKQMKNGPVVEGIAVEGICDVSPLIYIEPYYEKVQKGEFVGNVLKEMAELYDKALADGKETVKNKMDFDISDFTQVSDKIQMLLVNKRSNSYYLRNAAYRSFGDIAKVFYVVVDDMHRIKITREMLKEWEVDTKKLQDTALNNMPVKQPPLLQALDITAYGKPYLNLLNDNSMLNEVAYVLTNESYDYGAAAMLYPGVMEQISERIGGTFFILPSSVHKTILLAGGDTFALQRAEEMLRMANKEVVQPENYLSDSVYAYDKTSKEIKQLSADIDRGREDKER
ncbi:MAG: DUF5688 family protein [Anaerovoracaceae bacterium]